MEPRLPFSVPENYFEEFAAQLEEKIAPERTPMRRMMKPWLYMAAMFVGLLVLGNVILQVHRNNTVEQAENYEAYLMSQLDQSLYYDYYFSETNLQEEPAKTKVK